MNLFVLSATILAGVFLVILLLPLFIPIDIVEQYSRIFQNLGIGFGAIVGIGGFNFIRSYLEENQIKSKIKALKHQYPVEELGISFDLVAPQSNSGMIFIRVEKDKKVYHIGNYQTYKDLGFMGCPTVVLTDTFFRTYTKGPTILTRGEIGK